MYRIQLDADAFSADVVCLGVQLSEVVLAIDGVLPTVEWYGADVYVPGKLQFSGEHPVHLGSSKQLVGLVLDVGQFESGVFLAFEKSIAPQFREGISTDDVEGATLCNALLEVRTFDTSWIEIISATRSILTRAFSHYKPAKISEL